MACHLLSEFPCLDKNPTSDDVVVAFDEEGESQTEQVQAFDIKVKIAAVRKDSKKTTNVGVTPTGAAASPCGRFVYVANSNAYGVKDQATVAALDTQTGLVAFTIHDASFSEPYAIAVDKTGRLAYVTNSASTTISVVDLRRRRVVAVIEGLNGPSSIALTPNGKYAYVGNYGANGNEGKTVTVVDLRTRRVVNPPILVDPLPQSLAITADGSRVVVVSYVDGNPGTGTATIISTATHKIIGHVVGLSGPFCVAVTRDGKQAYVSNFGSNDFDPIGTTVSVIDLRTLSIEKNIAVGLQPAALALTPDDRLALVSNYNTLYAGPKFTELTPGEGTVNLIDLRSNTVIPPILVTGQGPHGIVTFQNPDRHRRSRRRRDDEHKRQEVGVCVTNYIANTTTMLTLTYKTT